MRKMSVLFALTFVILAAMPAAAQRRVSIEGRVTGVVHEHDGDRVNLDRGNYSFWVPSSLLGRRQLRIGDQVRLAGVYRGSVVRVDDLDWISHYPEGDVSYLSGRVEQVNRFEQRLVLRDDRGRKIDVDGRSISDNRRRHIELNEIRRGDTVTLRGRWTHGTFYALRIETLSAR
jgi:hypothetical protein